MGHAPLEVARAAALVSLLVAALVPSGGATIGPAFATADDLAKAIQGTSGLVTGAVFDELSSPMAVAVGTGGPAIAGFPTLGPTFAVLTTGSADVADEPNVNDGTTSVHGTNARGAYDVVVLRLDFIVPNDADCFTVSFRFFSEEYPEYVGADFNDGFVAELDQSTWYVQGGNVVAPDNFAFLAGDDVNVNTVPMTAANAAGTTYDGGSALETVTAAIGPGGHTLFLSLFDVGDALLDSAVFVDGFDVGVDTGGVCAPVGPSPLIYDYSPHGETSCVEVTFKVLSAPAGVQSYDWDFGDGQRSTDGQPTHKYATGGMYMTSLRVFVAKPTGGQYMTMELVAIIRNCPPIAEFAMAPLEGSKRVASVADLSFDQDSDCLARWDWDFAGEAHYSEQAPPPHRFETLGLRVVRLTVWDCQDTVSNTYQLEFMASNAPPFIDPIPPRVVPVGTKITFLVSAVDPDHDLITLQPDLLPGSATFATATATHSIIQSFEWNTTGMPVGNYQAYFEAFEAGGGLPVQQEAIISLYDPQRDADGDGVTDISDTCPANVDRDQSGVCKASPAASSLPHEAPRDPPARRELPDSDRDGVVDVADNCPAAPNQDQLDRDRDRLGDACDADVDGDGVDQVASGEALVLDNCPQHVNPAQEDGDGDGVGDACDRNGALTSVCAAGECMSRPAASDAAASVNVHARRGYLLGAGMVAGVLLVWGFIELRQRQDGNG